MANTIKRCISISPPTFVDIYAGDMLDVGPATPTNPSVEFWFDTDEPVRSPLGVVAYAQVTAVQATITTGVDLTGLSVTFTAVSGRPTRSPVRRTSTFGRQRHRPPGHRHPCQCDIAAGGTACTGASITTAVQKSAVLSTLSGSTTCKLRASRSSGTGTVMMSARATAPSFILVEDMGILS